MSSSGDEDDKFLYGSDEESTKIITSASKRKADSQQAAIEKSNKKQKTGEEYNQENNDNEEGLSDNSSVSGSGSDYSDSESDSDVEFIIGTGTDDASKLDSTVASQQASAIMVATEATDTTASQSITTGERGASKDTTISEPTQNGVVTATIDINGEGLYEGEPISSLDPEVLKEKPWRQPGANLSDYFNYGFNESTWMEYLNKQEKLRQEYNPHKILMGLMTLQQQGKLNPTQSLTDSTMNNNNNPLDMNKNMNMAMNMNMNMNNQMKQSNTAGNPLIPPHGFPMFGGFSPFAMPMMPQMPQQFPPQQKK